MIPSTNDNFLERVVNDLELEREEERRTPSMHDANFFSCPPPTVKEILAKYLYSKNKKNNGFKFP